MLHVVVLATVVVRWHSLIWLVLCTKEFIHESVSIWYINPVLSWFDLSLLPDFPEHPVGEVLFTLMVTWDILMWPLMAADPRGVNVKYKRELWYGSLALLTAFLLPYMALRLSNTSNAGSSGGKNGFLLAWERMPLRTTSCYTVTNSIWWMIPRLVAKAFSVGGLSASILYGMLIVEF